MNRIILYILNIFSKGWQISLLVLLPFIQKDLDISLIEIGFLSMVVTATSIIVAFFAGQINDLLGNRAIILISILCYVFVWIGFSIAETSTVLYLIYMVAGISSGLFDPIASAIVAKAAHDEKRGTEIGNFASVGDIGRIALTAITTFLVGIFTWKLTVLIFAGLSFLFALLYLTNHIRRQEVHSHEEDLSKIHPLHILKSNLYTTSLFAGILDSFSSSSLFIFLPFLLIPKGITIESTGFFTALFFFGYFSGRLLLGRIADKYGKAQVLIAGEICMALLIISLIFINSYGLIVINLFLLGVFTTVLRQL